MNTLDQNRLTIISGYRRDDIDPQSTESKTRPAIIKKEKKGIKLEKRKKGKRKKGTNQMQDIRRITDSVDDGYPANIRRTANICGTPDRKRISVIRRMTGC